MNVSFTYSSVKHTIARAIACGALLALTSCQIPKLRPAEPGPGTPTDFNRASNLENTSPLAAIIGGVGVANLATSPASSENSAQLRLEEFYTDPLLTQLIQLSLTGNQELRILEQEVQIARNDILAKQGAYLPFVTVGADGGMNQYSRYTLEGASRGDDPYLANKFLPNPTPNSRVGLNVFWRLDIWRAMRNARDAALQRYIAAGEKRNAFVTRLVAETAENYYKLMALDRRIDNLNSIIELQEQSLKVSQIKLNTGRGTLLPVQRFQAEVHKNQSEKLIVLQEIIEVENRINFLVNRYPQRVERVSTAFLDLIIHDLSLGLPSQLLQNRPDIRQAERELVAAGLDVKVARAAFFPDVTITGGVGFQAFNPMYLFTNPAQSLAANAVGGLVAPLVNKKAIQADYLNANARQLEAVYNYQRVVLNAFTEVINRMSMVENYGKSIEIKKQQLESLVGSVESATKLLNNAQPGVDYMDVLFAQRDLRDARMILIDTKQQQLAAIVNTYQALGGGGNTLTVGTQKPQIFHQNHWRPAVETMPR